jgi:hypothetical protein
MIGSARYLGIIFDSSFKILDQYTLPSLPLKCIQNLISFDIFHFFYPLWESIVFCPLHKGFLKLFLLPLSFSFCVVLSSEGNHENYLNGIMSHVAQNTTRTSILFRLEAKFLILSSKTLHCLSSSLSLLFHHLWLFSSFSHLCHIGLFGIHQRLHVHFCHLQSPRYQKLIPWPPVGFIVIWCHVLYFGRHHAVSAILHG